MIAAAHPTTTLIALTRDVSETIANCELTHRERERIDVARAREQHLAYEEALRTAGCAVSRIAPAPELADAVFVEDTALAFDELAVITRPGAESRRPETVAVKASLAPHRDLACIQEPGTMDGGDVLAVGKRVFAGLSSRTNEAAIGQLRAILCPFGYSVDAVPVHGCLHLKSAVTALTDDVLLINRAWTRADAFHGLDLVDVHPFEPFAGNILRVGGQLIYPAEFPRTLERIERRGFAPHLVPAGELAKAEGGVTCCSLVFENRVAG
jgi:dimethylargininase